MNELDMALPAGAVVLRCGPDTAYYNIRLTDSCSRPLKGELDTDLQEELEALKLQAQQEDESVATRWAFEGQTLFMRDKGGSQFKWIMENDKIILSVGRGKKTGIVGRVRLGSEYLTTDCESDLSMALNKVFAFLVQVFGSYILLEQSGLDLCADVLFLSMDTPHVKEQFVSRAVLDTERPVHLDEGYVDGPCAITRRWKKIAGLSFGMHTSVTSAVIYNKTDEIRYHSPDKKWLFDLWRRRAKELGIILTEDMIVWRVEVRFQRTAFREFPEVSGAYDVLNHLRDLWTYGVGHPGGGEDGLPDGWLRYVVPSPDTNRSRWPVHPDWEVIQHAFDPAPVPESEQQQEQREAEEYMALVDQELEARPWKSPLSLKRAAQRRKKTRRPAPAPVPAPLELDQLPLDIKPFVRKRKRQVNMDRATAQLLGWLALLEAWRQGYQQDQRGDEHIEQDISATLHFAAEQMERYMDANALDYATLVHDKRVLYRLEQPSGKKRQKIA